MNCSLRQLAFGIVSAAFLLVPVFGARGDTYAWTALAGYPFWRPLKIVFDPADPDTIVVTNWGGGLYRGVLQ